MVAADNFSLTKRDTVKTQLKKVEQLSISKAIILVYFIFLKMLLNQSFFAFINIPSMYWIKVNCCK